MPAHCCSREAGVVEEKVDSAEAGEPKVETVEKTVDEEE